MIGGITGAGQGGGSVQALERVNGTLTRYELRQWGLLDRWLRQEPAALTRWFGHAAGPASRAMQAMVPPSALRLALEGVHAAAERLSDPASVLRMAGVSSPDALRWGPLETCDLVATSVRRRAALMAGGSGAVLGVAGAAGLVADVPALMTLAFRSIHQTAACYGEELEREEARRLATAVFALASANTREEKYAAMGMLRRPRQEDATADAWRDGLERAAERELAKEAASMTLNDLALRLARHLGYRKASGLVPVVGAVVGASVNAWYLHDLCTVAGYSFQSRWLRRRYPGLESGRGTDAPALL